MPNPVEPPPADPADPHAVNQPPEPPPPPPNHEAPPAAAAPMVPVSRIQEELNHLSVLINQYKRSGNARLPAIFAGVVALILLGLWAVTTLYLVGVVLSWIDAKPTDISSGLILVNTTIGGLVSALIVAVMAASDPGGNPAERLPFFADYSARLRQLAFEILAVNDRLSAMLAPYFDGSLNDLELYDEIGRYMALQSDVTRILVNTPLPVSLLRRFQMGLPEGQQTRRDNNGDAAWERANRIDQRWLRAYTTLIMLYISVWIGVGLVALVVGVIQAPQANETLQAIGTTWLGIAVAVTYAYFGIKPQQDKGV